MNLQKAIILAAMCHENQVDKNGKPYILHPLEVMFSLKDYDETHMIVAVLHDVMEDCGVTEQILKNDGYSQEIIDAIKSVSRLDKSEDYMDFIKRASLNKIGSLIKLHDLLNNMDPKRQIVNPTRKDLERQAKYLKAYKLLLEIRSK